MARREPLLFFALPAAALVWLAGALRRSLWTDELHSLHHVRKETWSGLLAAVRSDNHPPLSFAAERVSVRLLGESELALRLPSLLAGLLFLVLLERCARRLPPFGRRLAVAVAALSSFGLVVFTEARMYGWLALAVTGVLHALVAHLQRDDALPQADDAARRAAPRWWLAAWVTVGLYAHYYFVHYLFVTLVVLGWLAVQRPNLRDRCRRLVVPLALAGLAWAPWGLHGFLYQLGRDYPAGGHETGLAALVQSFFHLLFMNTGFGGPWFVRLVALPGAALAALLALVAARRLLALRPGTGPRLVLGLAIALAVAVPAWAMGVSLVVERASFGWRYVAGSLGPLALLLGAGGAFLTPPALRRAAAVALLLALAAGTALNLAHGEREDFRGAVAHVLAEARPGDAVVVKPLWDPEPEGSPDGWHWYVRRAPQGTVQPTVVFLDELPRAYSHERVWIFQRDPYAAYALRALRRRFALEERWVHGLDLTLYLFSARTAR